MTALFSIFLALALSPAHPFHVSLTNCNYNEKSQELEISIRVFTDDLSMAINQTVDGSDSSEIAISKYLQNRFYLSGSDGKRLQPEYLGLQTEVDVTYLFLRIRNFPQHSHYRLQHSLLFDMFDDQTNIVKLQIGDKTASAFTTLDEPTKQLKPE